MLGAIYGHDDVQIFYRKGVYDALAAVREEIAKTV